MGFLQEKCLHVVSQVCCHYPIVVDISAYSPSSSQRVSWLRRLSGLGLYLYPCGQREKRKWSKSLQKHSTKACSPACPSTW